MFGSEIGERIVTWIAIGGALLSVGFGAGVNYANRDHTKRMAELEEKRQKEAVVIDKIVTKYVDKIITREVPVYVPNDSDCQYASGSFRLFFDSSALDKGLPEATGNTDAAPVPFADLAGTIAATHKVCHDTADQVEALQEWAAQVTK